MTDNRKATFLLFLAEGNTVTSAARAIGVSRQAAYQYRDVDAGFKQAWDNAIEEGLDTLEDEAIRRAKKSSDLLLIFMLKAKRPEIYRETIEVNVNWRAELRQSGVDPEQYLQQMIEQARLQLEASSDIIDITTSMQDIDVEASETDGRGTT